MTPEARELHRRLRPVVRRLAIAAAGRLLVRAVIVTAAGLLVWAVLAAIVPVPFPLPRLAPPLAAALAVGALAAVRWRRPTVLAAARVADRRAGLADRLGTAVDLLARAERPAGLRALQIRDALSAAAVLEPRAVAPIRPPKDVWLALLLCFALAGWGRFGAGLAIPGTPAGRMAAAIHREGRALVDLGRRLEETGRARRLPETLRAAPAVQEAGRRLEAPRIGWDEAVGQVRDVVRQLQAAQDTVRRRINEAMAAGRADRPGSGAPERSADRQSVQAQGIEAARFALEDLAGALRNGTGSGMSAEELARRLRALSDSLDQLGAPPGVRAGVDRARRAAESGQRAASAAAMAEALQDLQGLERMLGDEQALGDARRQAQQSEARIAQAGRGGGTARSGPQAGLETSPPTASGPNPVTPGDGTVPPPPGPNQGSLPGRGTVEHQGVPTPRLGGTRTESRLEGLPGPGTTGVREIVGPGRAAPAQRAAGRPPADVVHELDRALSQDPLPPAYVTLVRRYFETLGGAP